MAEAKAAAVASALVAEAKAAAVALTLALVAAEAKAAAVALALVAAEATAAAVALALVAAEAKATAETGFRYHHHSHRYLRRIDHMCDHTAQPLDSRCRSRPCTLQTQTRWCLHSHRAHPRNSQHSQSKYTRRQSFQLLAEVRLLLHQVLPHVSQSSQTNDFNQTAGVCAQHSLCRMH